MDDSPDHWQQQQLEEERQQRITEILDRVASGTTRRGDAVALAAEIGISYSIRRRRITRKPLKAKIKTEGPLTVSDMTPGEWFICKRTGSIYQYRRPARQSRHVCRTWITLVMDVTLDGDELVMRIDPPMRPR